MAENIIYQKIPLSVFIIIKNEEKRIAKTINSINKIADEIIIIDSGSTDNSLEICRNLGCKIFFKEWEGFGKQKLFGQNLCKNLWVLNIDADEEISVQLLNEIYQLFLQNLVSQNIAWRVKIVNKFFFEEKPHKFAYFYNQLRLYHKNFASFSSSAIHDSVLVNCKENEQNIGQLQQIIYHQSFLSFSHWIEKINFYSNLQAIDAWQKGKKIGYGKIFLSPFLAFLKALIVRRYFIYGLNGIIYSIIFAFSRFAKAIKIKEQFAKNTKISLENDAK